VVGIESDFFPMKGCFSWPGCLGGVEEELAGLGRSLFANCSAISKKEPRNPASFFLRLRICGGDYF